MARETEWTVPDEAVEAGRAAIKREAPMVLAPGQVARAAIKAAAPFIRAELVEHTAVLNDQLQAAYAENERLRRKLRAEIGEPAPVEREW